MNTPLAGTKRRREPSPSSIISMSNSTINYTRTYHCPPMPACSHCNDCQLRHNELMELKIQINERMSELNKIIDEINYRFNERGNNLSYIM